MHLGMKIIPLEVIPSSHFWISYHPEHQHGGVQNFWSRSDPSTVWCDVL